MREHGIERAVRDARLGPIVGGTDEIIGKGWPARLGRMTACSPYVAAQVRASQCTCTCHVSFVGPVTCLPALAVNSKGTFAILRATIQKVSMAKLITQRAVLEIADQSLQITGADGYMRECGHRSRRPRRPSQPNGDGSEEIKMRSRGRRWGCRHGSARP
jgi:alkylation response protein AidB-like acyl-CoA dehydrogenase